MYLTRAFLNPRRQGALRLLSNPERIHAAILAGFPQAPGLVDAGAPRILWRLDTDDPHRPVLWIVSPRRPDLTHLIEQAGWPAADESQWESRSYGTLLDSLKSGQRFAFRLTANPTFALPPEGPGQRGRRVGHVTARQQLAWLVKRSAHAGFTILPSTAPPIGQGPGSEDQPLQLVLTNRDTVRFHKHASDKHASDKHPVTIARACFEGALEVTDLDTLRATLITGLGPAKAYGCGLLTLAPRRAPGAIR